MRSLPMLVGVADIVLGTLVKKLSFLGCDGPFDATGDADHQ
jgi:hypothetical protein